MDAPANSPCVAPVVDGRLLEKYDRPGPRYTSYPTAPHFHEEFGHGDFLREIKQGSTVNNPPPLSIYFHLPFCRSVCFFCGCNVIFTADRKRPEAYLSALSTEMGMVQNALGENRKVAQMHWGGGTPTFLSPDQIRRLAEDVRGRFCFEPGAEISVEIDPRETGGTHISELKQAGFNRLSMGVQDFDDEVQRAIHRIQPEALTRRVFGEAREAGFSAISVDLIYGLPAQSETTFARTAERILDLNPDRIALFNFAYLPQLFRHQKAIQAERLPAPAEKIRILQRAIETFTSSGYRYIGMDHFAKPDDALCRAQDAGTLGRNFQGYTPRAECELIGMGLSSISQTGSAYAQNHRKLPEYMACLDAGHLPTLRGIKLSSEDVLRREIIMRLLCVFELDTEEIGRRFQIDFESHFANDIGQLDPMIADGLVAWHGRRLKILPAGRMLARNIAMAFDAYLDAKSAARFSRTV